jgi:hypothetical protein
LKARSDDGKTRPRGITMTFYIEEVEGKYNKKERTRKKTKTK